MHRPDVPAYRPDPPMQQVKCRSGRLRDALRPTPCAFPGLEPDPWRIPLPGSFLLTIQDFQAQTRSPQASMPCSGSSQWCPCHGHQGDGVSGLDLPATHVSRAHSLAPSRPAGQPRHISMNPYRYGIVLQGLDTCAFGGSPTSRSPGCPAQRASSGIFSAAPEPRERGRGPSIPVSRAAPCASFVQRPRFPCKPLWSSSFPSLLPDSEGQPPPPSPARSPAGASENRPDPVPSQGLIPQCTRAGSR